MFKFEIDFCINTFDDAIMVSVTLKHKYMDTLLNLISEQSWFGIVTAVIALASAIAAATPTPKAGSVLAKLYFIVDFLALNVSKAKDTGK